MYRLSIEIGDIKKKDIYLGILDYKHPPRGYRSSDAYNYTSRWTYGNEDHVCILQKYEDIYTGTVSGPHCQLVMYPVADTTWDGFVHNRYGWAGTEATYFVHEHTATTSIFVADEGGTYSCPTSLIETVQIGFTPLYDAGVFHIFKGDA